MSRLNFQSSETPNHALQRTAPCVTAPASAAAFPPTMQVPRRTPRSLSLGSLGLARAPRNEVAKETHQSEVERSEPRQSPRLRWSAAARSAQPVSVMGILSAAETYESTVIFESHCTG